MSRASGSLAVVLTTLAACALVACSPQADAPSGSGPQAAGTSPAGAPPQAAPAPVLIDAVRYVDPLIGTAASNAPVPVPGGAGGGVFPGASVPFGMVQWSPDTPNGQPSYAYGDSTITGFSVTHYSGAGCSNNGDIPILPATAALAFHHENEHASAGSYDVTFDNGIRAELTATTRTGLGRFTYPGSTAPVLVVDASRSATLSSTSGVVTAVGSDTLEGVTSGGNFCWRGNRYALYFVLKVDQPWSSISVDGGKATLQFDPGAPRVVQAKLALSYVSLENARANLATESPDWSFEAARAQAKAQWNTRLNAIQVSGGSDSDRTKFYTALYHAMMFPNVYNDVNGQYLGFDNQTHQVEPGHAQYANFSGWDIYRSQIPLLALLFPKETGDISQSLVADAEQCGAFPKWSQNNDETNIMKGDPGALIIATGYAFGATGFDTSRALDLMRRTGSTPGSACNGKVTEAGLGDYLSRGYVGLLSNLNGGYASVTLELNTRDFAVAQLAKALGDKSTYRLLMGRSGTWRYELNDNGDLEPRYENGWWMFPLQTGGWGAFVAYEEASAEQSVWTVPFAPQSLFDALGGSAAVVSRLDTFFTQLNAGLLSPYLYIGNEPAFAVPWLYDWAGAPWRTQDVVRRVMDETFTTGPEGLPGNDDLGATSAWYVWAALGLYPEIPGVGGFAVASPQFEHAVIHLGGGQPLRLDASGAPARYIQKVAVQGAPLTSAWLPLEAVADGGAVTYTLGPQPSSWAADGAEPPSFGPGSFDDVAAAYNSHGVGSTGLVGVSFDGQGGTYPSAELAEAGLSPGAFTFNGVSFSWAPQDGVDNVLAEGQTLRVEPPASGSALGFLGAATDGPSSGEAVIHYEDGSSAHVALGFSDWTLNGGGGSVTDGNQVAVATGHRSRPDGSLENVATYVFYTSLPLAPGRKVVGVTLPPLTDTGELHVFSMAVVP